MCGSLYKLRGDIAYVRFNYPAEIAEPWVQRLIEEYEKDPYPLNSYYTRPTNDLLALLIVDGHKVECQKLKWGHAPERYKGNQPLFNARGETLEDKPTWAEPWQNQRCLIPAGGFFEWVDKQPHAIENADSSPATFAGLWREDDGIRWCSIVTCEPSESFSKYHDREPVILRGDEIQRWLKDSEPPTDLIKPSAIEKLRIFPCTKPSHDNAPVPVVPQGRQSEMF